LGCPPSEVHVYEPRHGILRLDGIPQKQFQGGFCHELSQSKPADPNPYILKEAVAGDHKHYSHKYRILLVFLD
jgi:hypothetical protein